MAAVLMLVWRQVPSVCELTRLIGREDLFWTPKVNVSQQALSKRFLIFPAELFQRVLMDLLPTLRERWWVRQRPLPASIVCAQKTFSRLFAVDGSTLEALFRKLEALKDAPPGVLAGKICTVIDLASRLPEHLGFTEDAQAHDATFLDRILAFAQAGTPWIFDRGFYDFTFFDDLMDKGVAWITRAKSNMVFTVQTVLLRTPEVRDRIIVLGGQTPCRHLVRLIEVRFGQTGYRYLTSVRDPALLPASVVADLYRRRWRIEETFLVVKRLLNLSYLWTGSVNGVLLQVWSTWLFFAVLVDLGDAVAEELMLPFDRISLEMVFRSLYYFIQAYDKGEATDPVKYLAAPENRDLRGQTLTQETQSGVCRYPAQCSRSLSCNGWVGCVFDIQVQPTRDEQTGELVNLASAVRNSYVAHLGGPEVLGELVWAEARWRHWTSPGHDCPGRWCAVDLESGPRSLFR